MSDINQSFVDRVRYTLFHDVLGSLVINEPVGWNEDEKEYARNEDYHGIFAKFSNALTFVGEAAEFVNLVKELYGIQTDLRLVKDVRHPKTDEWENEYYGYLDLGTWTKEDKGVSVKFNSGGIEEQLKARESEETELDRLTTMDGEVIDQMRYETLEYTGRRIFLKSALENVKPPDNYGEINISANGYEVSKSIAIPLRVTSRSHVELADVPPYSIGYQDNGSANQMFFLISERDRLLDISLDLTCTTDMYRRNEVNNAAFRISLTVFENGSLFQIKQRYEMLLVNPIQNFISQLGSSNPSYGSLYPPVEHHLLFDQSIQLLAGESLGVECLLIANLGDAGIGGSIGHLGIAIRNPICKIKIDEDSKFESTTSKFYLPFEAFERLLLIYTGRKGLLKSKVLGRTDIGYTEDGPASLIGINHGFWIRGFDALPLSTEDNENLFKPLTTSIRNFMDSFAAVANLGMGIERTGYNEKIIVEDKKHFYNRNVTIKLPNQVKNVKRTIALKHVYSSIEIGYDKGGSYDEAQGLDEPNGKNNYNTVITKTKNIFTRISNYRADSYGKEFCRRLQKTLHPFRDSSYDTDIFLNDLKRGIGGVFKLRFWQDDFDQAPTGIFSPETATELRLSPFNLLLKHGWEIMAGLTKNPTDYIRYSASTGNSGMKTKLTSTGIQYTENGIIINSDLDKARFEAEYVEFDHKVDFEINKLLDGYTVFGGEKVYNIYGLIEFINEDGEKEKGWLVNLKPNKEGKWQLLKFNKR